MTNHAEDEIVVSTLLCEGFLDLVFRLRGGKTESPPPPLTYDWEELESRNFVIVYTIKYAFKIWKGALLTSAFSDDLIKF